MALVTKKQRTDNYNKNKTSSYLTSAQISTPFLSFLNGFNPPRSHVLSNQHYKKEDYSHMIYTRMDFSESQLLQENFTSACDRLTR